MYVKIGGFYVSRYEIGDENGVYVSKNDVKVINEITKEEASKVINGMYDDTSFKCELLNGYAYDTMLDWVMKTNEVQVESVSDDEGGKSISDLYYVNIGDINTGRNKYNNIYDLFDNVYEITQENLDGTVVVRGFLKDDETMYRSRFTILNTQNEIGPLNKLTFRTMIYQLEGEL